MATRAVGHSLAPWDTSMCWRCYIRQSRRHASTSATASSPSQRTRPPKLQVPGRGIHSTVDNKARVEDLAPKSRPSNVNLLKYGGSPGEHAVKTKSNIRNRLRQWQIENAGVKVTLPQEPSVFDNSNNLTRPMTVDQQKPIDDEEVEDAESYVAEFDRIAEFTHDADQSSLIMRRGDLVELPMGGGAGANLAVFLRLTNGVYQYLALSGKVYNCQYRNAIYQEPNLVNTEVVESIIPHIPYVTVETLVDQNKLMYCVPGPIAEPITSKIAQFRDEAEAAFRTYSSAMDHAHEVLADPTSLKFMFLEDVVSKLTGITEEDGQPATLIYAVSKALVRGAWGFSVDPKTFAESRIVAVESAKSVGIVRRVQTSLRAYQEEMALTAGGLEVSESIRKLSRNVHTFVRKARALIAESRTIRYTTPEGTVLTCKPSSANTTGKGKTVIDSLDFSDSDRDFISFLGMHASSRLFYYHQQLRSLPSIILRATDSYTDRLLELDCTHTFLVEIGVTQPYDNAFALDRDVFPPIHNVEPKLKAMQAQIDEGRPVAEVGDFHDSMSSFRKDWGNLQVFCIDSAHTYDIDDGISIERIEGKSDEFWFHSHICHISAFTKPDSVFGKYAEARGTSLYLPDARMPMLPDWASSEFSLASGKPVVTFSARMNDHGDILEIQIQPGIIRNVMRLPYEELDVALDPQSDNYRPLAERLVVKVGKENVEEAREGYEHKQPTERQITLLRHLYNMSYTLGNKRAKTPFGSFAMRTGVTAQSPGQGPATYSTDQNLSHARFSLINPSIQYTINTDYSGDLMNFEEQSRRPSNIVVMEAMLLTGVIAAKWASERNIPLAYFGTRPATDGLEDVTRVWRRQVLDLGKGEHGWSRNVSSNVLSTFVLRNLSSRPVRHSLLGFPEYTKISSPLRRYLDLMSMWQIDAALKLENKTGQSLVGWKDESYLPLSRKEIDKIIRMQDTRMKRSSKYAASHSKHWSILCIARAHYLKEAELPYPLTAIISSAGANRKMGRIEQLEASCDVSEGLGDDGKEIGPGEVWQVEIASIIPFSRTIHIKGIKRLGTVKALGADMLARPQQLEQLNG